MKLFVGLGNIGSKYNKTRHNIGFMFVDKIVESLNGKFSLETKFKGSIYITKHNGVDVCFLKPSTYMNLSGEAVKLVKNYYDIKDEDIVVVLDDLDLKLGKLRLREKGGHAGHNGMRNIIDLLQTKEIKRIRIGIDKKENVIDYVLGKFSKEEMKVIDDVLIKAYDIFDDYTKLDYPNLMNRYNTNE